MVLLKKILVAFILTMSVVSMPGALQQARASVWTDAWLEVSSVGISAGYNTNYREGTLQIFIARIIAQVLTFIGILFFVLVLYAGILWMTAAGNEDQVGKARKILTMAGVGLAIVVLAYAITAFVMRAFLRGACMDSLNPC